MLKGDEEILADLDRRLTVLETRRHEQLIFLGVVILIFLVIFLK